MEDRGGESKARVVRCLNCHNLLPELADISFHRCGGCGVEAKGSSPRLEPSSDKLARIEIEFPETSKRTSENKAMVSDEIGKLEETARKKNCLKVDDQAKKTETECYRSNGLYRSTLPVDDTCKGGKAIVETISVDKSLYTEQAVVRDAKNARNRRRAFGKGVQLASYLDEGPSNYYHQDPREQNLAPIQMELLRMLDELRDQLQRTCAVKNKQKMSVVVDRSTASSSSHTHHVHANAFPGASFPLNRNLSSRTSRESERNASKLASSLSRQFSGVSRGQQRALSYQGSYFTNNSESPHLASPLISASRSVPSTSLEPQVHRRALFGQHGERLCRSFAGGAPFVICNYCFELLELPGKSLLRNKTVNKVRCGACSKLISVYGDGSRNVVASPVSSK